MKTLNVTQLEKISGGQDGSIDGVIASACGVVAATNALAAFGFIVPTFGAVLVGTALACTAYGIYKS